MLIFNSATVFCAGQGFLYLHFFCFMLLIILKFGCNGKNHYLHLHQNSSKNI